jgi:poly-gamma-glutamate synthase PgsB/CapB
MNSGLLQLVFGLGALTVYVFFLLGERVLLATARRRLRLVIHVNGTRGKSTVTRMVHALLLEAGYRAWGKTTGTEPRLLLPDGGERLIRRLGPANVREQRNMLLRAVRGGADALVFECNAVRPELQLVSSAFLDPDLLVITNARLDHGAEQGDAESAARSFAATIPAGKALASSDTVHRALWEAEAEKKAARFVFVDPREGEGCGDLPENVACAFAVGDWLGLSRDRAARAIGKHRPDPGAFRLLHWKGPNGNHVWFADALAANDPESSDRLAVRTLAMIAGAEQEEWPAGMVSRDSGVMTRILLVALRRDRPERTRLFVDYAIARCRRGKKPAAIGSVKALADLNGPGTAASAGLPVFDKVASDNVVFDNVVFAGSVPRGERFRLGGAGVKFKIVAASSDKIRTTLEEQVSSHPGAVLVFATGNRVGGGRIVHDWAFAQAASGYLVKLDARNAAAVVYPTQEAHSES